MTPDIRLDTGLHTRLEQRLRLAPQIIQSIEILQLPTLALEELIHHEMAENPVLEMRTVEPPEVTAPARAEHEKPADDEEDFTADAVREWRDLRVRPAGRRAAEASERKQEAMLNTAARPISLQDYLVSQLHLVDATEQQMAAGTDIIYSLDDSGYLRLSLEELAALAKGRYTLDDAAAALTLVQSLEPAGVGARDLRECLLLQVPADADELVRQIIRDHLEDIEQNRLPRTAQKTGRSMDEIESAVEFIARLDPRPGRNFGSEIVPKIVPDVAVEYTDNGYEVRLEDDRVPNLFISSLYERLANSATASDATKKYLRDKIRAARWLMDAIEQRRTTLYRIARSIVDTQKEFFDYGLSHLKPLRMQDIADKVGVHVSTVSRAIADKYIQTPRGIFALKYFFSGGLPNGEGEGQTWRMVQQQIKDLIDAEDKRNPLADDEIARLLSSKGAPAARRTVTKYRKALGIPSSRRRRVY